MCEKVKPIGEDMWRAVVAGQSTYGTLGKYTLGIGYTIDLILMREISILNVGTAIISTIKTQILPTQFLWHEHTGRKKWRRLKNWL